MSVKRAAALPASARQLSAKIAREIRKGRPDKARALLLQAQKADNLVPAAFDALRARVAASYFYEGRHETAFELARASAQRSGGVVEEANWIAGLAAWQLKRIGAAQTHFEALARSKTASRWQVSAGAYWAARAYLVAKRPDKVNPLLKLGARYPRTFYGLLSARLLGQHIKFNWAPPALKSADIDELMQVPAIARVIALVQAGQHDLADMELRGVYLSGREALGPTLVGLASRLRIPATQLRLAHSHRLGGGDSFDGALFPTPPWVPADGFSVDRALVYAFMRQESGFYARAKSGVGARGLMQLMPRTASYVANDASLKDEGKHKLLAPAFNVEIGQKYLGYLLEHRRVRGNLFLLAAAYNSGPGTLGKWLRAADSLDDPLLFIESIPSRETRFFVERVLTNFWIYRYRLKQDTPSLDAVASGYWPYYLTLDGPNMAVAQRNVWN